MKLSRKLTLVFLAIGIIPVLITALFTVNQASTLIKEQTFHQLQSIRGINKARTEAFFAEREGDMEVLSKMISVLFDNAGSINKVQTLLSSPHNGADSSLSFFDKYVKAYDYYDLFLISPDGDVLYTAAEEADLGTNLLSGPYRDSGLGQLFRKVRDSGEYRLQDFAPYAPSDNEPAAFIAHPVTSQGQLVMVVALQLSIDKINSLMQIREGMGETGESYLVGADHRMRSDSFLDPEGHSVKASFAGTVAANGVDSLASREALAGSSGIRIITDYNGNPVLSAFTPIAVGGERWALLSEIDEAEAFAPITTLELVIGALMAITLVTVTLAALRVARSVTAPLGGEPADMKDLALQIADGNLNCDFSQASDPDSLYAAMQRMTTHLREMIGKLIAASSEMARISEETSVVTAQTRDNTRRQQSESQQLASATTQMSASIQEVADRARDAFGAASTASDDVQLADQVARQTSAGIEVLATDIQRSTRVIQSLEHRSADIGSVLDVIQGVSEQTNLLALNAAIEAARAGEQGRGFAVVADEVRGLARKTQESTTDIEAMINQLQNGAREAAQEMNSSAEKTGASIDVIRQSGAAIASITEAIRRISDMNAQIASATEQQSAVATQIDRGISQISQLADETSGGAEQTAEATLQVAKLAEQLREIVDQFKV